MPHGLSAISAISAGHIKNFGFAEGTPTRQKKKNILFLCFVLVYSYLCTKFAI